VPVLTGRGSTLLSGIEEKNHAWYRASLVGGRCSQLL